MQINRNNIAHLCGTVSVPGISFHHENMYVKYYILYLDIKRLSDNTDHIPVVITQDMYDRFLDQLKIGTRLNIVAEIRSFNRYDETGKMHMEVYANACKIDVVDDSVQDRNDVNIKCKICKEPNVRKTPNGKRITDLMLMCNRTDRKNDFIPAITWGSISDLSANITTNDKISVCGRFQSRNFIRKTEDDKVVEGISYEVSINTLEIIDKKETEIKNTGNTEENVLKKEGI